MTDWTDAQRVQGLTLQVGRLNKQIDELREQVHKLDRDKWCLIDECGSLRIAYKKLWSKWRKLHPHCRRLGQCPLPEHLEHAILVYEIDASL